MKLAILKLALTMGLVFVPTQLLAQTAATTAAAASTSTSTSTSNNTDPMVPYRAYAAAVNSNNLADAARFGSEAWQLAEAKWGSTSANTAGLAYNAAWSAALAGKSSDRLDAAKRAVELAPIATESYSLQEAQFLLAYAEFFAIEQKDRDKAAPKLAAAALPVEATWNDYLLINALVNAAIMGSDRSRGGSTIAIADRALSAIDRLNPNDGNSRSLALLARAQGRLSQESDLEEAVADLIQARVAYGAMRTADDRTWGKLAAWEVASRSFLTTTENLRFTTGSRLTLRTKRPLDMTPEQAAIVFQRAGSLDIVEGQCEGVKRINRVGDDIAYPTGEASNLRVAGVVIRFDLDATGNVINPRLLGAVPEGRFSDNAMRAIRTWRFALPANANPQCLKDKDISFSFTIE